MHATATATYSNAMDVGNPNNFPRLLDLCRGRLEYVRKEIWGHGATDDETIAAMKTLHDRYGYVADPHTILKGVLKLSGGRSYTFDVPVGATPASATSSGEPGFTLAVLLAV